jgi:hypothetical protein
VQSSQVEEGQKCLFSCINNIAPNLRAVMVNPNRFYIYAYLREDRTPYYIGKGQGKRLYQKGKKETKPPKDKSRIIFLKQNLTEEEAFKHEIYMIAVFGRKDLATGILRNKTAGGEGSTGNKHSEKSKKKMSGAHKGRIYKPLTEEHKNKLSESNKGKHIITDEIKNKISNSLCKKTYKLISPAGEEIVIKNITKFCKENNLSLAGMRKVMYGKQIKPYKGWTGQVLQPVL